MPKRERFGHEITCKTCKTKGRAEWTENENTVYGGPDLKTELVSVSKGFKMDGNSVRCETCGNVVPT